jgi:hypothetical protein
VTADIVPDDANKSVAEVILYKGKLILLGYFLTKSI